MKKNKFVVVGAGSSYTPAIVAVLLSRKDDLKLSEVCTTLMQPALHAPVSSASYTPVNMRRTYRSRTPPTSKPHSAALISCSFRFVRAATSSARRTKKSR